MLDTILTPKTTSTNAVALSEEMIADLLATFRMIQDDIKLLLAQAQEEGWTEAEFIAKVEGLFNDGTTESEILQGLG